MDYIDLTLQEGGGSGGTTNYNDLSNQPQINGVTLTGDKSSTDLGIFLPDGYTVTVATDDSGDFTDIQSALNSLNGKVCAGTVTIDIKAGTYNCNNPILIGQGNNRTYFNFSKLIIQGNSSSDTILNVDNIDTQTGAIDVDNCNSNVEIKNLKIVNKTIDTNLVQIGIRTDFVNFVFIHDVIVSNFKRGIYNLRTNSCIHNTTIDSTVTMDFGIMAAIATIYVYNLTVTNYTTGVNVGNSGVVGFNGGNYAISNVTNRYSQSKNTVGVGILYGVVNETIV